MLRAVLFDLDGVLIDSLTSIQASMNHALAELGRPTITREEARPLVGPPLARSAPTLLQSDEPALVDRFIALYRTRYAAIAESASEPMAGLGEVIPALARRWTLAVATSKPEAYARPILSALGVAGAFKAICGGSLEHHRDTKATVIGRVLAALEIDAAGVVMVGDRSYDVVGAAEHGIPTIGALHGMAAPGELEEAGARWLIRGLGELPPLLDRLDRLGLDAVAEA
ncbi:MAG: HAD hydrolase-like protein [Myxococcales bacterium]|nr:HAD hydrolase-like protein [Myxococcales bacterium]MCB9705088.1 HAD hydrolase-like protein [Myxococcales bacterium]